MEAVEGVHLTALVYLSYIKEKTVLSKTADAYPTTAFSHSRLCQ